MSTIHGDELAASSIDWLHSYIREDEAALQEAEIVPQLTGIRGAGARMAVEDDVAIFYPTIGREDDNTIIIANLAVSGYHARIDKTGTDFIVTDLQSTNGTFVNNKKVVSQKLAQQFMLRGRHQFSYSGLTHPLSTWLLRPLRILLLLRVLP